MEKKLETNKNNSNEQGVLTGIIKNHKKKIIALLTVFSVMGGPNIETKEGNILPSFSISEVEAKFTKEDRKLRIKESSIEDKKNLKDGLEFLRKGYKLYKDGEFKKAIKSLEISIKLFEGIDPLLILTFESEAKALISLAKAAIIYESLSEKKIELIKINTPEEFKKYQELELPKIFTPKEIELIEDTRNLAIEANNGYDWVEKEIGYFAPKRFLSNKIDTMLVIAGIGKFLGNAEDIRTELESIILNAEKLGISTIEAIVLQMELNLYPVLRDKPIRNSKIAPMPDERTWSEYQEEMNPKRKQVYEAKTSINLGHLMLETNNYEDAIIFFEEAISILEEVDNKILTSRHLGEAFLYLSHTKIKILLEKIEEQDYKRVEIKTTKEWKSWKKNELPKLLNQEEIDSLSEIEETIERSLDEFTYCKDHIAGETKESLKIYIGEIFNIAMSIGKFIDNPKQLDKGLDNVIEMYYKYNFDNSDFLLYYTERKIFPVKKNS